MKKNSSNSEHEWLVSSGNIFEDLGIPDAVEHDLKAQLAIRLNRAIASLCCSQSEIARMLGVKQPHVSQLMNYKLQGFSVERLMVLLMKLGHAIDVRVSDQPIASPTITVSSQEQEHVEIAALMGDLYESFTQAWMEVSSSRGVSCTSTRQLDVKVVDVLGRKHFGQQDDDFVIEKMTATFAPKTRTLQ